jgi:hypothetical protein
MKAVQHKVKLEVDLVITVDEDETDVDAVIADMDYDFNVHPETDHAEIVTTEIKGYEVVGEKTDTIAV